MNEVAPAAAPQTAHAMTRAASRFLAGLTGAQRETVMSGFADEAKRRDWSFLPEPDRDGLHIGSLDAGQRAAAIIHHRPPPDLATRMVPKIGEVERPDAVFPPEPDYVLAEPERDILSYVRSSPKGVPGHALSKQQLDSLFGIVRAFAGRVPADVAAVQLRAIEEAGRDKLVFAWAGGTSPGERHYFRIQGPSLLIEHDNTQDNGAHIHSVWRNPVSDFGDDVLGEHYRQHHPGQPGH